MEQLLYSSERDKFVSQTSRKIASFAELPVGWHYGEGGPAAPETIQLARILEAHLKMIGFSKTSAFPGPDGDIMVVGYRGPHDLEVIISPVGRFDIVHVLDRQDCATEEATKIEDAKAALTRLGKQIWGSLGLSMGATSTTSAKSSRASGSSRPMMAEPQYYARTASARVYEGHADTLFISMTTASLGTPQSTGPSPKKRTPRRAA